VEPSGSEYGLGVRVWCFSDTGVPRKKAGEAAMTMTNLCSNPKGKRGLAIPSKVIVVYRKSSFGLAEALPSLPERVLFTAVWNNSFRICFTSDNII
jgi:hypothetical protein